MAWGAAIEDIQRRLNDDFDVSATEELDDTDLTIYLGVATSRVDAILAETGYSVAAIQADATTGAYKFCNALVIDIATYDTVTVMTTVVHQATTPGATKLKERIDRYLKLLTESPRDVLADISHPDTAATRQGASQIAVNTDRTATFTSGEPNY